MIKYIALLFTLSLSAAHAKEEIFFTSKSPNITTSETMIAISHAALKRKWTISGYKNNKLRIKLNHRDYNAVLDFSFSERRISYLDFTTYSNPNTDDDFSFGETKEKATPVSWVRNLQRDTNSILLVIENIKKNSSTYSKIKSNKKIFSHENTSIKLESLKNLYNKKLVTEAEYELKKLEILSRY